MLSGISPWQLLILLAIVLAIFGTKKLRNIGGDLGSAMRDFRGAMREDEDKDKDSENSDEAGKDEASEQARVVDHQNGTEAHTESKQAQQSGATDESANKRD